MAGATTIIATDPGAQRLAAASALGATHVIAASETPSDGAAILAATNGRGLDVVFEVSGDAPAVDCAVTVATPGGRVILLGIPPDDRTAFNASAARRKGLTFKLTRRSTQATFRRAVKLAEAGSIDLASLG